MTFSKTFFLRLFFLFQSLHATPLAEEFKRVGYVEIENQKQNQFTFDSLYAHFDQLIEFFQANPLRAHQLNHAKERFIRSKDRNYYSTDFFGFYDQQKARNQIAFYYSVHFHAFVKSHCPEFNQIPEITCFFDACFEIEHTHGNLFNEIAADLDIETIFSSQCGDLPILLKVVKYFPAYCATKPHYDGTAFSFFLDSTDTQSLLLSPYKPSLTVEDFSSPLRKWPHPNSILLIPGAFLTEFSIYPTPHIVIYGGKTRYATIAFAMRPNYVSKKIDLSSLPNFKS